MGVWDTHACANGLESTTGRRQNRENTRGYTQAGEAVELYLTSAGCLGA
jgi:hypothetical protein